MPYNPVIWSSICLRNVVPIMKLTNEELDSILAKANLKLAEPYHENQSYSKSKHLLTECMNCGVKAHYTLSYIMGKTGKEPVCRREYWSDWYDLSFKMQLQAYAGAISEGLMDSVEAALNLLEEGVSETEAREFAEEHGYELIQLFQGKRPGEELFHVKCKTCGRIEVERKGDVGWGCSCRRVPPSHTGQRIKRDTASERANSVSNLLCDSGASCVAWWDHDKNSEEDFRTTKAKGRGIFWWKCPECGYSFQAPVFEMSRWCKCPMCYERRHKEWEAEYERLRITPVSEIPELLEAWDDEHDPSSATVATWRQYRFKCPNGHHPRVTPYTFMMNGCPSCKAALTRKANETAAVYLKHTSPELTLEWNSERNGSKISPDNVKITSTRNVWWKCLKCGHEWQRPVYQRDRSYGQACPKCGKVLNSFAWQYPGIAAEWSPNNPVSPWNIYPGASNLTFVPEWVCKNDSTHVWRAGIASRIRGGECPECRDYSRSRIALKYHEALKKLFGNARAEVPLFNESFSHNPWTVDTIFSVGNQAVVVEYDGEYWHADKLDVDKRKSEDLLDAGYLVIRLRENDLPSLNLNQQGYTELRVDSQKPNVKDIGEAIAEWVTHQE